MDGYIDKDGYKDGRMNGWMDGQMDKDGCMDVCMDGWMDGCHNLSPQLSLGL